MQDKINYIPTKCSMAECAFPKQVCSRCPANVSIRGKQAVKLRNFRENYQFCMRMSRQKR